jgi:hypothetical protein
MKRGREKCVTHPSNVGRLAVIVYLLEGHSDVLCRSIVRQMPGNGFKKFARLRGDFFQ